MTPPAISEHVIEALSATLASDRVPGEARLYGARLLDRLRTPVNVVVMGRPQAGKSRLIEMLSGRHPPVPLATRTTLTEVTLEGSPETLRATADRAFDSANIVLWCTETFDAVERALWAVAPDTLKDNSFLVVTKADRLLMTGRLQDRLADLSDIVAQEFHSLYPVATLRAIAGWGRTGQTGPDLWSASGGRALHDAVLRLVDTGQRTDADNALLFLSRYAATAGPAPAHRGPPVLAQDLATPQDGAADAQRAQVLAEALAYLQDRADSLLSDLDMVGSKGCGHVLSHCLETATTLSDLLGEFTGGDTALSGLQGDVQESADMMLLLQLEQSDDAATDAVTLLLQLKKDMADRSFA